MVGELICAGCGQPRAKCICPETPGNKEPRITVDYTPGRWGKVFHLFDTQGREIELHQKEATQMARNIIKIAGEKN